MSAQATSYRPTIAERVGVALAHGNLDPRRASINTVIALGVVGIEESIADAVFRLKYANDPASYSDALRAVIALARAMSRRHNWRLKHLYPISKAVLDYWLCSICPTCMGRRDDPDDKYGATAQSITGTPYLNRNWCGACEGLGQRPEPWRAKEPRTRYYHSSLLRALRDAEQRIRQKVRERLAAN